MEAKKVLIRIVQAREKAGLDITQASDLLKCDRSSLSKKESGQRRVYLEDLLSYSQAYGCPVTNFFDSGFID